jgi:hypothetical protein
VSAKAAKLSRIRPTIGAPLPLSPGVNHAKRSSREKGRPPRHTSPARLRLPTCSQRSCRSAGSTARELNAALTCGSLERRRLDDGASSPLVIHIFDVADEIADDLYLVDILILYYDVREPIFDHDH